MFLKKRFVADIDFCPSVAQHLTCSEFVTNAELNGDGGRENCRIIPDGITIDAFIDDQIDSLIGL